MCQTILRWSSDWSVPACRTHLRLPAAGIWACLRQEPGRIPLHQATVVPVARVSAFALFDQVLGRPYLVSITAIASSSEAAITQPALSAATRSSRLGVAAIQMATAEVSSCTAQHCSSVSSTNQSSSSPRAISTRLPRSTITLSSRASWRSSQRRVCCCVVLPGEVGRAVIAYTSHASLRARCASSASPSASRTGRCSHPFCIVQGGRFHPLDAITPSMSTPTLNGSMTDT